MRKHLLYVAASLTVGGLGFATIPAQAADAPRANPPAGVQRDAQDLRQGAQDLQRGMQDRDRYVAGTLPPGIQRAELDEADDIRETLADATEAALNKDNLNSFVGYFVDADRNRIGDWKAAQEDAQLKMKIDQIQQAWKTKFGGSVDIESERALGAAYRGFQIVQGEITDPNALTNWPVRNVGTMGTGVGTGTRLDQVNRPGNQPGDRNLERGRDVAIVSFPAGAGMPELHVSLINEAFGWKIDVPDNVSGDQLRQKLLQGLTKFYEKQSEWPTDPGMAQRHLTYYVLSAVYGGGILGSDFDRGNMNRDLNRPGEFNRGDVNRDLNTGDVDRTDTGTGIDRNPNIDRDKNLSPANRE